MKKYVFITFIMLFIISCNEENNCANYLANNKNSMDVLAIPVIKDGIECGFFIGYNSQIYETIYLEKYPNKQIDYKSFLIKLFNKEILLDEFLSDYNVEIINYDSTIVNGFIFSDYLIKKDEYYYLKDTMPLSKQYNIIKILFDKSYQIIFNDYAGEYSFKKCKED